MYIRSGYIEEKLKKIRNYLLDPDQNEVWKRVLFDKQGNTLMVYEDVFTGEFNETLKEIKQINLIQKVILTEIPSSRPQADNFEWVFRLQVLENSEIEDNKLEGEK